MKIDDINAFVAVVRNQSVSAAADALGLTQSAITRRLQSFETDLGAELLDRSVKPPRPNAMGRTVFEQCGKVLLEVERLRGLVQAGHAPTGLFRIGLIQTIGDVVLLDTLQRLNSRFPGLHTEVASGWGAQLVGQVEHGEVDAAVALFPTTKVLPQGLSGRTLGRIELAVVAQKGAMPRRGYRLRDCYDTGWVLNPDGCGFRAGLERALNEQGLSFKVKLETFGADLQLSLVAKGMGLGLMPLPILERSPHREKLDILKVADFKPVLDIWLIQAPLPEALQQAVDFLADSVEQACAAPARD
jgi:DNA-binding transcriptional LysR family regulator